MKSNLKYNGLPKIRFILVISLTILTPFVHAQEQKEEKEELKPIPTVDIIKEADATSSILNSLRTSLSPEEKIIKIEKNHKQYIDSLYQLRNDPEMQKLDELSASKLRDLHKKWMSLLSQLSEWQKILVTRSEKLENDRISLIETKRLWEATLSVSEEESVPNQMLVRIKTLLDEIDDVQVQYRKRLDKIIVLQNKISEEEKIINAIISQIDELLLEKEQQIFIIDSKALWEVFEGEEEEADFSGYISGILERYTKTLSDFFDNYKDNILIHLILLFSILVFLLVLRRFGNQLIQDKQSAEISREILNHPYSVALLVTLLITPELYPRAPDIISKLAHILSLVPVLRLLPVLYELKIRRILIIFGGIYFLNLIYLLSSEHELIDRIFLLGITLLSLTFLVVNIRKKILHSIASKSRLLKFGSFMIKLFVILFIISLVSNIIGNVSLANLLTTASLTSIYIAFILLTGSPVVIGLINLILSTKMANISRMVLIHSDKLREKISKFIYFLASIIFIYETMKLYTIFDSFYNWFMDTIAERLQIGSVDISLGDILVFFLAIYASVLISRIIRFVLEEDVLVRMRLPRGVPSAVSMLTNYAIIGLGLVIAFSAAGIELDKFALMLGALGVGIGFGLQNIVNNFISGLILIFERPIQLQDTIAQGELYGQVSRIGIRSSTIRTFDGAEVIVPNANLISNEVTNWTLSDHRRRIRILVGVAYGTDPEKVLKILKDVVLNHPDILDTPEPMFLFKEFGESSLNFDVRFWTADSSTWLELQSEVTVAINNVFKKEGIEIPFPQRDLHVRSVEKAVIHNISDKKEEIN